MLHHSIRLLSLRRRIIHRRRALRTTPIALPNIKGRPIESGITFPSFDVNNVLFGVYNRSGLSFIIYTDDLGTYLEFTAGGSGRKRFQECDCALSVDDAAGVEFGDAGDGNGFLGRVEVDYFLSCAFERCGGVREGL